MTGNKAIVGTATHSKCLYCPYLSLPPALSMKASTQPSHSVNCLDGFVSGEVSRVTTTRFKVVIRKGDTEAHHPG
jgi:hypothetical protein